MTISIESRRKIVDGYIRGVSMKELNRLASTPMIVDILKKHDVPLRRPKNLKALRATQLDSIVDEYLSGAMTTELCEKYRICDKTVSRLIRSRGYALRSRKDSAIIRKMRKQSKGLEGKTIKLTLTRMAVPNTEESSKDYCLRNWDLVCDTLDDWIGDLFVELYDRRNYYLAKILLEKYL